MEHQYHKAYALYASGVSVKQIMVEMGISEGTVRTHIRRARAQRLRMVLLGQDPDAVKVQHIPKDVLEWLQYNGRKGKQDAGDVIRKMLIEAYSKVRK